MNRMLGAHTTYERHRRGQSFMVNSQSFCRRCGRRRSVSNKL